jgi:hypothetical protein
MVRKNRIKREVLPHVNFSFCDEAMVDVQRAAADNTLNLKKGFPCSPVVQK